MARNESKEGRTRPGVQPMSFSGTKQEVVTGTKLVNSGLFGNVCQTGRYLFKYHNCGIQGHKRLECWKPELRKIIVASSVKFNETIIEFEKEMWNHEWKNVETEESHVEERRNIDSGGSLARSLAQSGHLSIQPMCSILCSSHSRARSPSLATSQYSPCVLFYVLVTRALARPVWPPLNTAHSLARSLAQSGHLSIQPMCSILCSSHSRARSPSLATSQYSPCVLFYVLVTRALARPVWPPLNTAHSLARSLAQSGHLSIQPMCSILCSSHSRARSPSLATSQYSP
uniref:Uncharacterized protein n=1 Tax=Timema shepardi TaxID=629360 RepID=A0A7R9AV66_TIMSH|nr:unnamed protein product [Timema shepardi]